MRTAALSLVLFFAAQADAGAESRPLVAEFQTRVCEVPCKSPRVRHWYLMRSPDTIELRDRQVPVSQIWRRNAATGAVGYTYVMHDEKRVIEYNPIDLSLIARAPDWERLGSVLTSAERATLSPALERDEDGNGGTLSGRLGPAEVEGVWLRDKLIPRELSYRFPTHTVTLRLIDSFTDAAAPVAPTTDATLAAYAAVDYADLGDLEHDPQEQAWIRKAMMAPGQDHHDHGH